MFLALGAIKIVGLDFVQLVCECFGVSGIGCCLDCRTGFIQLGFGCRGVSGIGWYLDCRNWILLHWDVGALDIGMQLLFVCLVG